MRLESGILDENDRIADENERTLRSRGVVTVNLMGSPGAGKTSLLEMTAVKLGGSVRWAVIEGDIEGSLDARRLERLGVPVVQINTSGACHLDAHMVREGLRCLDLDSIELLFVENVGNLVCPAEFRIGESRKVMVLSTTEGEDKPRKYPLMFRESDLMVLSKADLLPHLDLDLDALLSAVSAVSPDLSVMQVSSRSGEGAGQWIGWLRECLG
ncbi:MAG: hydrogenase nickel incorporation protein HypB [Deltaproteobacteria bacterium]|nr:hydrogenase nickel incorporation protein HypB [Deltaproteobacteria bacterium]